MALIASMPLAAVVACGALATPEQDKPQGSTCTAPAPGCACIPIYWTGQACYGGPAGTLGKGKCALGTMTCSDQGILSACEGEVRPSVEECNGIDDDCNGIVDDLPGLDGGEKALGVDAALLPATVVQRPYQCDTGQPGICNFGHFACGDGGVRCAPNAGPFGEPETCNGLDDDCNGLVDDGIVNAGRCVLPDASLKGECRFGSLQCTNGAQVCVATYVPKPDVCNGLDDDCDGVVDQPNAALCPPNLYLCNGPTGCYCPYVFSWDGRGFRYETTVGGASLIGRREHLEQGRQAAFAPMMIRLDHAALERRGDSVRARAKVLVGDDEIAYLARARAAVVYHPPGHEIVTTSSMQWNALDRPDPGELLALRTAALRAPERASWMGQTDVTDVLSTADQRAAACDERLANFYELDFGTVRDARHARLVIEGWKQKKPRALAAGVAREMPRLEVLGADGAWRRVLTLGTPRGDRKAVMLDLSRVEFPTGRYEMRLWTGTHEGGLALWHLDRVRLTEEAPAPVRVADVEASSAELRFCGAPRVRPPRETARLDAVDDGRGELRPEQRTWGRFTRYGDVRELVGSSDDRLVVMRKGDGVELAFDTAAPRTTEEATLLLELSLLFKPRAWLEDGRTTHTTERVEPLPYHAMVRYPPPRPRDADDTYARYLREWQTREYREGDPRWNV
jgi:hypothetical protein